MNGGDVPENALVAGINKFGTPLYIVKAVIEGEVSVGKVSLILLNVDVYLLQYEILSLNTTDY